jgi:quercetin dioxygenase-like cupin family protein
MKAKLLIITIAASLLFTCKSRAQTPAQIFPKGDLSLTKNHTGSIWLNELNIGDSTFDPSIAVATYGPGAKLDWHIHPGGQVLLITEGAGYIPGTGTAHTYRSQG